MQQNQSNRKSVIKICVIALSIFGLMACIAVLFPQVRLMIIDLIEQKIAHRQIYHRGVFNVLQSFAIGGICLILVFNYYMLTNSGRLRVHNVKQEIIDCLSEIDFRAFIKPVLLMSGVYLLGILTIIRANFLYLDDLERSINGVRGWYFWSRYVTEFASIFIHGDTNLTEISPLPQLLAILILSVSSVLLVYVMGNGKITTVRLLASIPLGLSPYFLECLSFKFDAPYMALSVLAGIIPFLFITRKKAFLFCSVVSLLIMCMTYQASSGIYILIVIILCFQHWNIRSKSNKEILFFMGRAAFAFCFAMFIFKAFLMKPVYSIDDSYTTNEMYPLSDMISGVLLNIKTCAMIVNQDFGVVWKTGIILVCILFITKSIRVSECNKTLAFFISIVVITLSFVLSFGVFILLICYVWPPRFLIGFGVFLAILCIYSVSDYKRIASVAVIALNWCFLVFAFSYGNAFADHARYTEFRTSILLHDLSALSPNLSGEVVQIQLENSIDYAPTIKNISKHYPVIERLIPKRLGDDFFWGTVYYLTHFNFRQCESVNGTSIDFKQLDLPVVLDSYYHTIKSDDSRILVILKH